MRCGLRGGYRKCGPQQLALRALVRSLGVLFEELWVPGENCTRERNEGVNLHLESWPDHCVETD
jgi:hypothetical protein